MPLIVFGQSNGTCQERLLCMGLFCIFWVGSSHHHGQGCKHHHFGPPSRRPPPSPRSPATGVLREIAVGGLLADVVLLVVAMALGGVEGNVGRAAGALVALVVLRNERDVLRLVRHSDNLRDGRRERSRGGQRSRALN